MLEVCRRWGLPAAVVGDRHRRRRRRRRRPAAWSWPASRPGRSPATRSRSSAWPLRRSAGAPAPAPGETPLPHDGLPERGMDPGAVLEALLGHPNLGSRAWVTTQYDQTVGTDTVEGCDRAAGVLRVKGTTQGARHRDRLAAARGAARPGARRRSGASPSARATWRSPARGRSASPTASTSAIRAYPEAYWQLSESVRGLAEACRALGIPITGGNVSLYNESPLGRIAPTAQIGVVGLLDDIDLLVRPAFRRRGRSGRAARRDRARAGRLGLRAAGRRGAGRWAAGARPRAARPRSSRCCRQRRRRRAARLGTGRQRRRPRGCHRRDAPSGAASAPI